MLKVMAYFLFRLLCTLGMQGLHSGKVQSNFDFSQKSPQISLGSSLAKLFSELAIITCFLSPLLSSSYDPGLCSPMLGLSLGSLLFIHLNSFIYSSSHQKFLSPCKNPRLLLAAHLFSVPKQMRQKGDSMLSRSHPYVILSINKGSILSNINDSVNMENR